MRAASARAPRVGTALAGIVLLAAAVRFSTLGVQSFWLDEAYTLHIVKLPLGDVWAAVRTTEGSPPLYYYLAWPWSHVFGTSEAGLRCLSALIGTLTVPAAFYAGRELVSQRAGLVTALLVALNPWLVWYSQEARAYALLVLLSTIGLAFFARALRTGARRDVAWWAAASALAVCTHYFAAFTVAPEAIWLVVVARRQRRDLAPVVLGTAAVTAVTAALVPFALDQRKGNHQGFIHHLPRGTRLEDFVRHPLAGELGGPVHGFVQVAALLALAAVVVLFVRAGVHERRGALVALGIAVASVAIPLAFTFTSFDYLFARNSLAIAVPAFVFLAAGFAAARGGLPAQLSLTALCLLWMVVNVAVPLDQKIQRDDWRGAVHALGPPTRTRVVATVPYYFDMPLVAYLHPAAKMGPGGTTAQEIDLIRLRRGNGAAKGPVAIPGFRVFTVKTTPSYELDRYVAPAAVHVDAATLAAVRPSWVAFVQS